MHDYQCADVTISGAKPLPLIWSLPKKKRMVDSTRIWVGSACHWESPGLGFDNQMHLYARRPGVNSSAIAITLFTLWDFVRRLKIKLSLTTLPMQACWYQEKWSDQVYCWLALIVTEVAASSDHRIAESVTYSSKRKLQNKLVSKNIFTRKQFFWMWFTTCCIWTSSHICDSQKCCVKKMGWHNEFQSPDRNNHQLTK